MNMQRLLIKGLFFSHHWYKTCFLYKESVNKSFTEYTISSLLFGVLPLGKCSQTLMYLAPEPHTGVMLVQYYRIKVSSTPKNDLHVCKMYAKCSDELCSYDFFSSQNNHFVSLTSQCFLKKKRSAITAGKIPCISLPFMCPEWKLKTSELSVLLFLFSFYFDDLYTVD